MCQDMGETEGNPIASRGRRPRLPAGPLLLLNVRSVQQILLDIRHKLVAAAAQFAQHPVDPLFRLVPAVPADTGDIHRDDGDFGLWESHLIQHQATPGVKAFAADHCPIDPQARSIRRLAREEGIGMRIPGLILRYDGLLGHSIDQKHIRIKIAFCFIGFAVDFSPELYPREFSRFTL